LIAHVYEGPSEVHRMSIAKKNLKDNQVITMNSAPQPGTARKPLDGITVIDLTQIYHDPYATFLMAKAGADVIKFEPIMSKLP